MNAPRTNSALEGQSCGGIRRALSNVIKHEYILLFAGFILTCVACYLYVVLTGNGLRAIYGDSWVYTDFAKRIAFNHSLLHKDYVNPVIYPPLYPALISIAYFFQGQAAIFEAIKMVNIIAYSSAFSPMFYLLKHYACLSNKQSFMGAILLLINWCSLCYVIHIASEPLYCSLLVWFAWYLVDNKFLKSKLNLVLFILLFSSIPLTRTVGNLVFPCFAGTMIIKILNMRNNHLNNDSRKLIWRSIIVLIASALIILLYNMYLKSMLPKSPGDVFGGYLSIPADPLTMRTLLKPSYWFDRTAFSFSWILIGTGTVAVPLLLSIIIRNTKILYEDLLASFFFFILAGTFALVPLFSPSCVLGSAFERYYNPLLFVFIVILLKYSYLVDKKDMVNAGAITLIGVIIAPPLTAHASYFALSQTNLWAVYVLLYGVGGAVFILMLFILYRHKIYFINIFMVMMAMSIPVLFLLDYLGGNKLGPNIFSFYDTPGITREILSERALNPNTEFIVDISWRQMIDSRVNFNDNCWEYWKIMINLPTLPIYKELTNYLSNPQNQGKRFMLLTHQNITNAAKIVKGRDISLYIFGQ